MSTELFMLDSGAFTVWSKGMKIDINDYIDFCKSHPKISYYVCLDVIPGTIQNRKVTKEMKEQAAKQSFANYMRMCSKLPQEKVLPVWHRGENTSWIDRYMEEGCRYIGFGGLVGGGGGKEIPIESGFKVLENYEGVRVHGFGLTSIRLMTMFPWHSVDSTSWIKQGAYGGVWIPRYRNGKYFYDGNPMLVNVSPKSPSTDKKGVHYSTLSKVEREIVDNYFISLGVPFGEYEIVEVEPGYKVGKEELWFRKVKDTHKRVSKTQGGFFDVAPTSLVAKKPAIMRIKTRGLSNCRLPKFFVNMIYMQELEKTLALDHIYFAGQGVLQTELESATKKRLMSYHSITTEKNEMKAFLEHLERMP